MKNEDKCVLYYLPDRVDIEEGYFQVLDLENGEPLQKLFASFIDLTHF